MLNEECPKHNEAPKFTALLEKPTQMGFGTKACKNWNDRAGSMIN